MPKQSSCCAQGYGPDNAQYPPCAVVPQDYERVPLHCGSSEGILCVEWDLIQGKTAAARSNCVLKVRVSLPYMSGDAREQLRCRFGGLCALQCRWGCGTNMLRLLLCVERADHGGAGGQA